ncbi:MAG: thiamine biosynthesis protein ThiJ, partial [Burkholderiales bacterium PBB4]
MPHMDIAFLLFPGVTQLDLTGPAQVLSRLPGARVHLVWENLDPVPTDAGFSILPNATFADMPKPDLLCVPGGMGIADVIESDAALGWVRRAGAEAQWVTSVCTGALILGAAGLLEGYQATTHWAFLSCFPERFPKVIVAPGNPRFVHDRDRLTGGGIASGLDEALKLIELLVGEEHARKVQV